MSKTVPMSHRLPPRLKSELQKLADQDKRSLTNYVEIVLEKHVEATNGHIARDNAPPAKREKRK